MEVNVEKDVAEKVGTPEGTDGSERVAAIEMADAPLKAMSMRRDIIAMLALAGSGHPGGSLSATDIVAELYFGGILTHDHDRPTDPARDRFILSKGHAAPVLYAALAEDGYFPLSELSTLRKLHSRLQGHPDSKVLPGVEVSTGSLGQGLSIAAGLALGLMSSGGDREKGMVPTVFALLGDGEIEEGQVWEAVMFSAHQHLGNLVAIIDNNDLQIDGRCSELLGLTGIAERFRAFNWHVLEVDGHDSVALNGVLSQAKAYTKGPVAVIARTVKGKGVSFMEDQVEWHGKAPSADQAAVAFGELGGMPGWYSECIEGGRA